MKRLLLALGLLFCAANVGAQTTTFNGVVKDLTNTAVATGQVTFQLKPGIDTTISGSSRFVPATTFCEIHNPGVVSTSGTGTITVVVDTTQNWQAGDSLIFVGTGDATLNASSVASPYVITVRNSSTSFVFTQSGTHTNGAVGTVGGLYKSGGTGACAVMQNSAITPANTSYTVGIQAIFSPSSSFNTYAIGSGPVDISTVVPTPSQMPAYSFMDLFSTQTVTGNKTHSGLETFKNINGTLYLDGVNYTTLATCYAAIAANGGACVVPPNYTETLAASITVNKPHSGFIFTGPATITMGTNQVIVTAGTHGVFFRAPIAFGGTNVTTGVRFIYSGNGKAFQIGTSASATRAFTFENIKVEFSGATAGATGLYLSEVIYFEVHNPSVIGENVAGTFGIVCDGTGSLFCGTGRIDNPIIAFVGTGIFATGAGANSMNAVTISGGTIQNPVAGGIGVDIENGDANIITSLDLESNTIGLKLGAGATNNHALFRSEVNTSDVTALASSNSNVARILTITGTPIAKTDAGTNNHFSLAIDADFRTAVVGTLQAPAAANMLLADNAAATQAFVIPGAFEVANHLRMATGAKIDDAPTGAVAGLTLKTGSGGGNYTGTNTSYANVDTTNLCAVFTIPTGWKLAVTANGVIESVTAAVAQSFALSDIGTTCGGAGVTPLPGSERTYTPPAVATFDVGLSTQAVISGDGLNHAISLQAKTSAGADAWGIQNTSSTAAPSLIFTLVPSS